MHLQILCYQYSHNFYSILLLENTLDNQVKKFQLSSEFSAEVIIAGGQIFKMAASHFVDVSEEEIKLLKENAIPRNTKHATKFGMTLFKGKIVLKLS